MLCAMGLPPVSHSDDPARALSAALDILANVSRLGEGVCARVGVVTGRAFCGVIGTERRREYTVGGGAVLLHLAAAWMEGAFWAAPVLPFALATAHGQDRQPGCAPDDVQQRE